MNGKITVIGLGSSNEEHLSLGAYKILTNSEHVYFRTEIHPVVEFLKKEKLQFITFDYLYDSMTKYDDVYQEITSLLIDEAKKGKDLVYGVPGHPMVAEKSVKYILEKGKENNIVIEIFGGESFIDTFFSKLHIDPIEGFLFFNGETVLRSDLNTTKNIIIGQVYNRFIASDLKLTLMELYPDDYVVWIVSNLGIDEEEKIIKTCLFELDHHAEMFHHLSSVFVPKSDEEKLRLNQCSKLIEIVEILRSPEGCPWDRVQTHQSIRKHLIEETYELVEAIDESDVNLMEEELGDVLLQVLLHSRIAEEDGYFNIYDVIEHINKKLIRRHPHVFGDKKAKEVEDALTHWNEVKQKEKEMTGEERLSVLDGIPKDLPAVLKAYKIQKKAADVNFDWINIEDVYDKIEEEINELKQANEDEKLVELGDLLFSVINLARFLQLDPEEALAKTNSKFMKRFHYIEEMLKEKNIPITSATLEQMESYWDDAKKKEKSVKGEKVCD